VTARNQLAEILPASGRPRCAVASTFIPTHSTSVSGVDEGLAARLLGDGLGRHVGVAAATPAFFSLTIWTAAAGVTERGLIVI